MVLVIDDDPNALDLLGRTLQGAGVRVVTASNGPRSPAAGAVAAPGGRSPSTCMMPGMDGWEVLRELKADPETRDIPVIMVTMTDDREQGYALGATEFLTKPVDRGQLVQLLERYAPAGAERRALVVDDKAENRQVLRRALENEGWQVSEAENGKVGPGGSGRRGALADPVGPDDAGDGRLRVRDGDAQAGMLRAPSPSWW